MSQFKICMMIFFAIVVLPGLAVVLMCLRAAGSTWPNAELLAAVMRSCLADNHENKTGPIV